MGSWCALNRPSLFLQPLVRVHEPTSVDSACLRGSDGAERGAQGRVSASEDTVTLGGGQGTQSMPVQVRTVAVVDFLVALIAVTLANQATRDSGAEFYCSVTLSQADVGGAGKDRCPKTRGGAFSGRKSRKGFVLKQEQCE